MPLLGELHSQILLSSLGPEVNQENEEQKQENPIKIESSKVLEVLSFQKQFNPKAI